MLHNDPPRNIHFSRIPYTQTKNETDTNKVWPILPKIVVSIITSIAEKSNFLKYQLLIKYDVTVLTNTNF